MPLPPLRKPKLIPLPSTPQGPTPITTSTIKVLPASIPPLSTLTPTMLQFWTIKKKFMDKLIFFKMGQFYELFYEDAKIANKFLDLNWNIPRNSVGLREENFDASANLLLDQGFEIVVVEQVETAEEMAERLKNGKEKRVKGKRNGSCVKEKAEEGVLDDFKYKFSERKKEKSLLDEDNKENDEDSEEINFDGLRTLKRKVDRILTRSTFPKHEGSFGGSLMIINRRNDNLLAYCSYEANLNEVNVGVLDEKDMERKFWTLIFHLNPREIICNNVDDELKKIISVNCKNYSSFKKNEYGKKKKNINFEDFSHLNELLTNKYLYKYKDLVKETLAELIFHFESLLLSECVDLNSLKFKPHNLNINSKFLRMDSNIIEQLEIFEWRNFEKIRNKTFFQFFNRTTTNMGARMLKKWILSPLKEINEIEERLNAIEDLRNLKDFRDNIMKKMNKMPDLERDVVNVIRINENKCNTTNKKINKLLEMLKELMIMESIIDEFIIVKKEIKAQKLLSLLCKGKDSGFPSLSSIIEKEFYSSFEFDKELIIKPRTGISPQFDEAIQNIKSIHLELDEILQSIQKVFNDPKISFSHAKFRFEVEIAEKHVKGTKKPEFLEFTSAKAGYQRFLTKEIKEKVKILEEYEKELKSSVDDFFKVLHKIFKSNFKNWDKAIQIFAELDCLLSLSLLIDEPNFSRPSFNKENIIQIEDLVYPSFFETFTPVNISIKNKKCMLLTGPNMGGKSTLLKTLGLSILAAQIGSYVPAKKLNIPVFDGIFTRFGSKGNLSMGKSTFFVELEETKAAIQYSDGLSLVLMDELGIGTSSIDGVAISYAAIKYFSENKKSISIFTTHYKEIMEEFRNSEDVDCFKMGIQLNEEKQKIEFLYKLEEGVCLNSFGFEAAKMAGIDEKIIKKAAEMSMKIQYDKICRWFNKFL